MAAAVAAGAARVAPVGVPFVAIGPGEMCWERQAYQPTYRQCALIGISLGRVFEFYDHPTGALHEESGCMSWTTHHEYALEFIVNAQEHPCPASADVTCYCVLAR